MRSHNFSVALMSAGLLLAAPAYAQTSPQKQPTQEGGLTVPAAPNPNPGYKQPTQEGGLSVPAAPNPNPGYKQPTQEGGLTVPAASPNPGYKQPTQEGGLTVPAANPNPSYKQPTQEGGLSVPAAVGPNTGLKQHTQNLTPSTNQDAWESGKQK
jgi:hypothetical protein